MYTWTASSISRAGRLTIPQKLRARLAPRADGKVLLQEVADGVILVTREPLARAQIAEYLLDSLVTGIGPEADLLGFHDEEDLDRVVEVIRERTFAERYGTSDAA
jgi:bifunctional DNA-binding transcriptional regulator/antitoxin component of YhaV-PrlF toxin-antitoxin module